MNRKYELTGETKEYCGRTLYRIRALRDFGNVKAGDKGGWVESEENLSHEGNAWVYDNGIVCGNGRVSKNGTVRDRGLVCKNGVVLDNGMVLDDGKVCERAVVRDNGIVRGYGMLFSNARVSENGTILEHGFACGDGVLCGNAELRGGGKLRGYGILRGNGIVSNADDICVIDYIGSRKAGLTAYRNADGGISCNTGCFRGTLDELEVRVKERHGNNKYAREYRAAIELIKAHIDGGENDV